MADFKLKLHRGEGMVLIAMNWLNGTPPDNFVGFAIAFAEPGSPQFIPLLNRLSFEQEAAAPGTKEARQFPTDQSPIQKFRWTHFPKNASLCGDFTYRVTPVFMDAAGTLSEGDAVTDTVVLADDTYPGQLNIAFTRGYIASQSFVDTYGGQDQLKTLLPPKVADGIDFTPTNPRSAEAYDWMGFEARHAILNLLDAAIQDPTAKVSMVAFDFNLPEIVSRLQQIGNRLRLVVDNSDDGSATGDAKAKACTQLTAHGVAVIRQHMGALQHNKMIVVDGATVQKAVGGSTNFSWNGFFVQSNNAVIVSGAAAIAPFQAAFETYWSDPDDFPTSPCAAWTPVQLDGINMEVSFSPHGSANARLQDIANDIDATQSSLFYSLAFLYLAKTGPIHAAITRVINTPGRFVYGMSDEDAAIVIQKPDGIAAPVYYKALTKNAPPPFNPEPSATGIHLHHKFVVIDFDKPTARVYTGSHNFSDAADRKNGENLMLITDTRVATSYMVEAVTMFDHYHFNIVQSQTPSTALLLQKPPAAGQKAWWDEDYTDPLKIKDRNLFCPL